MRRALRRRPINRRRVPALIRPRRSHRRRRCSSLSSCPSWALVETTADATVIAYDRAASPAGSRTTKRIDVVDVPMIDAPHAAPTLKLVADAVVDPVHERATRRRCTICSAPCAEPAAGARRSRRSATSRCRDSLWSILVDEADQHLATLDHELCVLQFDPRGGAARSDGPRKPHAVRHPSHRRIPTIVASTASALEQALLALRGARGAHAAAAYPVLARADRSPSRARLAASRSAAAVHRASDVARSERDATRARGGPRRRRAEARRAGRCDHRRGRAIAAAE